MGFLTSGVGLCHQKLLVQPGFCLWILEYTERKSAKCCVSIAEDVKLPPFWGYWPAERGKLLFLMFPLHLCAWVLHYCVIPRLLGQWTVLFFIAFFWFVFPFLSLVDASVGLQYSVLGIINNHCFLELTWDNMVFCLLLFPGIRPGIISKALGKKWRDSCREWNQPTRITDRQVNGQWKAISMCRRNVSKTDIPFDLKGTATNVRTRKLFN